VAQRDQGRLDRLGVPAEPHQGGADEGLRAYGERACRTRAPGECALRVLND
jgi:hypothetical protein